MEGVVEERAGISIEAIENMKNNNIIVRIMIIININIIIIINITIIIIIIIMKCWLKG